MYQNASFDYWAEKASQRTGRSILDSGSIYGYNSDRPPRAGSVTYDVYEWKLEVPTVCTIRFLATETAPNEPLAKAVDDLLVWYGNTLVNENWLNVMEGFTPWLHMALSSTQFVVLDRLSRASKAGEEWDFPQPVRIIASDYEGDFTGDTLYLIPTTTDMLERTENWARQDGYKGTIATEDDVGQFPFGAIVEVMHNANCQADDIVVAQTAYNTYNGESDLDRVLQFIIFKLQDWPLAAIQLHNGCDVRGGYTRPYVCALHGENFGYNASGQVNFWCPECQASYGSSYRLNKAFENTGWAFNWVFANLDEDSKQKLERLQALERGFGLNQYPVYKNDTEAWQAHLEQEGERAYEQLQSKAGQVEFWQEHVDLDDKATALLSPQMADASVWYENIDEAKEAIRQLWIEVMEAYVEQNRDRYPDWEFDHFYTINSTDVQLRCPACGEFEMTAWHQAMSMYHS